MKLVTDARCRIQSRELFKPNTLYHAERTAAGRVELIELVEKEVPEIKAVRTKDGFVMFPLDGGQIERRLELQNEKIANGNQPSGDENLLGFVGGHRGLAAFHFAA